MVITRLIVVQLPVNRGQFKQCYRLRKLIAYAFSFIKVYRVWVFANYTKKVVHVYTHEWRKMLFLNISAFNLVVKKSFDSLFVSFFTFLPLYIRVRCFISIESWSRCACELRPVSRINVNNYTFMTLIFCRLCIH